jgi:hypothetical protein
MDRPESDFTMTDPMPDELAELRARLAEAAAREGRFRLESVDDYLALQAKLQQLRDTIGERGTYIHQLHLDQNAQRAELHAAQADLEAFAWLLQEAERARERAERRTPLGFFRSLFAPRAAAPARVPPGDFVYHLTTSPFRIYRTPEFTLRGWACPRDGRAVTAIRVRLDGREFAGKHGLPAPEAAGQHGPQKNNPQPGFEVTFATPPGRHQLALEAQIERSEWRSILVVPTWCQPGA